MNFYYEIGLPNVAATTPLGQWNVAGYSQVHVHMWIKGPGGSKVYPDIYFNSLSPFQETLQIGPADPGDWNVVTLAKVYPVFAPTLSIVLYNPSAPLSFSMRLYAACCGTPRLTSLAAQRKRVLPKAVDLAKLRRGPVAATA
ncbi:MAG: hypothetical protein U1F10_02205 [Burkholderiales bacterium]